MPQTLTEGRKVYTMTSFEPVVAMEQALAYADIYSDTYDFYHPSQVRSVDL